MDMTEYEALKEVQQQLKDSLENERVLRQELADANEREIEALKSNEKNVTIITENRTYEEVLVKGTPETIIKQLEHTLMELKSHRFGYIHSISSASASYFCDRLRDLFFTKTVMQSEPNVTVTRKGFDEVVEEVRTATQKSVEERHQQLMDGMSRDLEKAQEKAAKYEMDAAETQRYKTENLDLMARVEQYQKDLKELSEVKELYHEAFENIQTLKRPTGLFSGTSFYDKMWNVINDTLSKFELREAAKNYKKQQPNRAE